MQSGSLEPAICLPHIPPTSLYYRLYVVVGCIYSNPNYKNDSNTWKEKQQLQSKHDSILERNTTRSSPRSICRSRGRWFRHDVPQEWVDGRHHRRHLLMQKRRTHGTFRAKFKPMKTSKPLEEDPSDQLHLERSSCSSLAPLRPAKTRREWSRLSRSWRLCPARRPGSNIWEHYSDNKWMR